MSDDYLAPSAEPPAGLAVADVPMFIMIGFDDNPMVEPMTWIVDYMEGLRNPAGTGQAATFDGAPARAAFYSNGKYQEGFPELGAIHDRAQREGHEIGNHTQNHNHGSKFTVAEWSQEMGACRLQDDQDGTNFFWPYTLDQGSPGNALTAAAGGKEKVGIHPGLWEIPLHVFMVPEALHPSIIDHVRSTTGDNWSEEHGKITGLDWNVLEWAGRDGPEFYAILRHTLELRLAGNRAPLMIGAHTALYPADLPFRRKALEDFLTHALSHPDVRVVTPQQLLDWLRCPVALRR